MGSAGHTVVYTDIVSVVTWPIGQFTTVDGQAVIVYVIVVYTVEVVQVGAGVIGQTVVYNDMVSVVTCPIGQFVTVGAHEVIV